MGLVPNVVDSLKKKNYAVYLTLFIAFIIAFLIRVLVINEYGLSGDEVLKALATQQYRKFDFSENASHPVLMKIAVTFSVIFLGENEFALRLPNALVSSCTVVPIFLLGKKLYNQTTGLLGSFLWAVHLPAISFTTTAKEDAFLTFFWLFSIFFFLKARDDPKYFSHTGAAVGLAAASKYAAGFLVLLLLALFYISYRKDYDLPSIKETAKKSIPPAIATFSLANIPFFLPTTLVNFYHHYAPDSPERTGWIMMGELFKQRPPYYIILHVLIKTPLPLLIIMLLGVIFAIKDHSDSDIVLLIWSFSIIAFFSIIPYGYVRYYLPAIPALILLSVQGVYRMIERGINQFQNLEKDLKPEISLTVGVLIIALVIIQSSFIIFQIQPYYRMYVNEIGGGIDEAGYYFPQDSVYDYFLREAVQYVSAEAPNGSKVAMSEPLVGDYYGRSELDFIFIQSLPSNLIDWDPIVSFVIVQDSRIFYENRDQIADLRNSLTPERTYKIFETVVVEVYRL